MMGIIRGPTSNESHKWEPSHNQVTRGVTLVTLKKGRAMPRQGLHFYCKHIHYAWDIASNSGVPRKANFLQVLQVGTSNLNIVTLPDSNSFQHLMLSNDSNSSLKPFDSWLSSIPPDLPSQVMAARYTTVATLAVSWWCLIIGFFKLTRLRCTFGKL